MHSDKYSRGSILIVGGSDRYRGAMFMASLAAKNALAALRTGTGYVTIAAPPPLLDIVGRASPVFVLRKLTGNPANNARTIASIRHNVLVLGPGLDKTVNPSFLKAVLKAEKDNTIIIDGAALGFLKENKKMINRNMILTPHDGEFYKLTGINLKGKTLSARLEAARGFAMHNKCVLVLKGHETIIAMGNKTVINKSRTPALATMGTGDVLCGMIAAYAASGLGTMESAYAGVRVHSMIGDMLFKQKGMHIIATDIIEAIPSTLKKFDVVK